MTENKRGGAGRGQGRKALAGEVRKVRAVKMTDGEWEDLKLVTPERMRKWVAKEAAKLRKAEEPNSEVQRGDRQGDDDWNKGGRPREYIEPPMAADLKANAKVS